jgi:RNA polymerase sigma-70 factor (ECF subfamily)
MPLADSRLDPELLLAHAPFVRSIACALLHDENDVDDVVQQTWLAAMTTPPRAREGGGGLRSWLARVVKSRVREARRGDERRERREQAAAPRELVVAADPALAVERLHLLRELVDAVLALDEPGRSTVMARYLDELTPTEIAMREGVPVAAIETRLRRARARLRERLDGGRADARPALLVGLARLGGTNAGAGATAAVLAGATTVAGATTLAGVTTMSTGAKLVAAAAGVAIAGLAWVVWSSSSRGGKQHDPAASRSSPALARTSTAETISPPTPPERSATADVASAERVTSPSLPVGDTLRALVVAKEDGRPLPGATVHLRVETGDLRDRTRQRYARMEARRGTNFLPDDYRRDRGDLEADVVKNGVERTADAGGAVDLPRFDSAWVCARSGDLVLTTWMQRRDGEPVRLELEKDVGLRMRVFDGAHRPVAGAPLALSVAISKDDRAVWWRGLTGEDGIAIVPDAILRLMRSNRRRSTIATLGLPARDDRGFTVNLAAIPDAPIDFVLPPEGRVRVDLVDASGQPFLEDAIVGVGRQEMDEVAGSRRPVRSSHFIPGQSDLIWTRATGGHVELDHVGLGLELTAYLHVGDRERRPVLVDFQGPTAAGEIATVVMKCGEPIAVVTGRVVGPDGEPIRDWRLHAEYDVTSGKSYESIATDEEGCFRLPLSRYAWQYEKEEEEFATRSLMLTLDMPEDYGADFVQTAIVMTLTPEQVKPGVHDLGELRFEGSTIVAAGHVVDPTGAPKADAYVAIEKFEASSQRWIEDGNFRAKSDATGAFSIRGRLEPQTLRIRLEGRGAYQPEVPEFRSGASDVRVVVAPSAALHGRVLVDAGVPLGELTIVLSESLIVPGSYSFDRAQLFQLAADGSFVLDTVKPGAGSLTIAISGGEAGSAPLETLTQIDDLTTKSGETLADERLAAIDLRGKLRVLDLHVVDEQGRGVPNALVSLLPEPIVDPHRPRRYATADEDGRVRMLAAAPTYHVQVAAPGFEVLKLPGVPSSRELVLRRAP